jgi:4-hydroxy-3-methylbut-2-enyl diphosphate reductase
MNRLAVRELLAPANLVAPGEVLVPTEIGEPFHGQLRCPAAPLIGGSLRRRGKQVRLAPLPECDEAGRSGGAMVYAVTSRLADGTTAAVAACASAADRMGVAAARSAVEEWAAAIGSRSALLTVGPWCDGAREALRAATAAVAGQSRVHVVGQLAADPVTLDGLRHDGAVLDASVAGVPDGATVFIPAHGIPADSRAQAAARGLSIIDATCPLVARAQAAARAIAERGDELIIIGPRLPVTATLAGESPATSVAGSNATAGAVTARDPHRVSCLLQPGTPVEDAAPVTAALRSRFPALRGPELDGVCYAASDRAASVRSVAAGADAMLILGADCADMRLLLGLARGHHAKIHPAATVEDITAAMVTGASVVGIAEAASAAPGLAAEVVAALAGLGPLTVSRRLVRTEAVAAGGDPAAAERLATGAGSPDAVQPGAASR